MKSKFDELADNLIPQVGGKENVESLTHCMTRLRFVLYEEKIADIDSIKKNSGVVAAQFKGGQLQVVIGTDVDEAFDAVNKKLSLTQPDVIDSQQNDNRESLMNRFIQTLTKIITPTLGVLIATSLILGLLSVLLALKIIDKNSGSYYIMNALGYSCFTFFPVLLGYTSAKAFNSDKFIGMILGATIMFPGLSEQITSGKVLQSFFNGTPFAIQSHATLFGAPLIFPFNGYASTVIPIILIVFFASKVEKLVSPKLNKNLRFTFLPLITLSIVTPLALLIIGPIANILSQGITALILYLYNFSSGLSGLLLGILYTPLVMVGLHWPLITTGINNLATMKYDFLMPMVYTIPFAQLGSVLAVFLRTSSKEIKDICIPAMISDIFCIIEPSIYGITLPVKKRFVFCCIASGIGSLIIALFSVKNFASTIGLLGIIGFVNPNTGSWNGLIIAGLATIATFFVAFTLTLLTYKREDDLKIVKH